MPDQEIIPEVRDAPVSTSRLAQLARGGRAKARAQRGNAWGLQLREQTGDSVEGEEEVARPISPFEVDRHISRVTEYELALIRKHYHVPDYVQFRLPGPADQPIRPPPYFIAIYRDYFIRRLWLPLHPFI